MEKQIVDLSQILADESELLADEKPSKRRKSGGSRKRVATPKAKGAMSDSDLRKIEVKLNKLVENQKNSLTLEGALERFHPLIEQLLSSGFKKKDIAVYIGSVLGVSYNSVMRYLPRVRKRK